MHRPDSFARGNESRPTDDPSDSAEAVTAPGVASPLSSSGSVSTLYSAAWARRPSVSFAPRAQPPSEDPGPTILGRYELESLARRGAISDAYFARHRVLEKKVVIEVLRPEHASDPDIAAQFLGEAKTASIVQNAHFIDVLDFGRLADGGLFSILERLDGVPLSTQLISGESMPERRMLSIARQVADGLAAAHAAYVFHGDLTLEHVLLVTHEGQADFVKLRAFGRAAGTMSEPRRKVSRRPESKDPSLDPEGRDDLEPSIRREIDRGVQADIEAFGAILYRLASGLDPLREKDGDAIPLRALEAAPRVAPGLEAIMLTALSRRAERYRSMREIVSDLAALGTGGVPDALLQMIARSPSIVLSERALTEEPPRPPASEPRPSAAPSPPPLPWPTYAAFAALLVLSGLTLGVLFHAWLGSATSTVDRRPAPSAESTAQDSRGVMPER